ncbi:hypothetical protein M413DRAFT_6222 [Hebeloma cylindrosporum]|uniref:Uncharacterized protein n=1 Tax=Hebeloma cylindrosporum TaxID=76867 RepID=A0A0C3CYQ6_HEBCY|nr:hypothetical protein M413DRAFT_6222 [Hebeloma cylindrosporum h7]
MSSSPTPPSVSQQEPMSAQEKARRELEDSMRSSLPPGDGEDLWSGNNTTNSESDPPLASSDEMQGSPANSHIINAWHTSSLRIEMESARRLAVSKKLHPYQRDAVETFLKASPVAREAHLFVFMCELGNKLDSILSTAPAFTVSSALLENIKAFTVAVLLSSKLEVYKGVVPRDHVLAIIRKEGLNIPPNLDRDPHIVKVVGIAIAEELTQARSRVKKAVGASIKNSTTIYDLADALTDGTRCIVSVPLCARLSLLRKVYLEDETKGFWDSVDARLKLIRSTANGDARKITRAFRKILDDDRQTYGDAPTDIHVEAEADAWQE